MSPTSPLEAAGSSSEAIDVSVSPVAPDDGAAAAPKSQAEPIGAAPRTDRQKRKLSFASEHGDEKKKMEEEIQDDQQQQQQPQLLTAAASPCTLSAPSSPTEQQMKQSQQQQQLAVPAADSNSDSNASSGKGGKTSGEEENESACCECEGGGELICCDTCVRAFHLLCLPQRYRPPEQNDATALSGVTASEWSCPICMYFRVHDDLDKRRGILLTLEHPLPVPSQDADPRPKHLKQKKATDMAADKEGKGQDEQTDGAAEPEPERFTHQDLYRLSHHHYLFDDIKKNSSTAVAAAPAASATAAPAPAAEGDKAEAGATVGSRTRRAAAAAAASEKKTATTPSSATAAVGATAGGGSAGRMNVGPAFQTPQMPLSFLEVQDLGRSYDRETNQRYSRAVANTRLVYSATDWRRYARRLKTKTPFDETPEFVAQQPPHKKAKLRHEGGSSTAAGIVTKSVTDAAVVTADSAAVKQQNAAEAKSGQHENKVEEEDDEFTKAANAIADEIVIPKSRKRAVVEIEPEDKEYFVDTEEKLKEFCRILAARWSSKCHWPYSDEYAYKILHYANFNSKAALRAIADPSFDCYGVCDPPVRPYFNKWRPKDRRSSFPSTPFPPPTHFRAAFCAGTRTRQQKEFGYR